MTPHCLTIRIGLAAAALVAMRAASAGAQGSADPRDTLRLPVLQDDALRRDPRALQFDLLSAQSSLRLRNLSAERLPSLGATGQAQYQSEVIRFRTDLPGFVTPVLPRDSYDARLDVRQRLWDPTLAPRRGVERAQLAESQARLRSSLYALRQSVNDAFFTALLLEAQRAELETGIIDLEAQLRLAAERVRGGAALPSETAIIEAELLRRRQTVTELAANRAAALQVLGELTGRTVTTDDVLAIPDDSGDVAAARGSLEELRARPEYEQFGRGRELLDRKLESLAAQERPRLSAYGRAGYGRPGLDPLSRNLHGYWLAGVQVEWNPWSWGSNAREREVLELQRQIVDTDEAAFTESIRRGVATDLAAIDRLEGTLGADDSIITLRERVLRETRLRFGEGVITSAEYVDRQTDVLTARLTRATHRVELARARARFLTLAGAEVR